MANNREILTPARVKEKHLRGVAQSFPADGQIKSDRAASNRISLLMDGYQQRRPIAIVK